MHTLSPFGLGAVAAACLAAPGLVAQSQSHVADFANSNTPQGLGFRGAYVNGGGEGSKNATSHWWMQFFGGHLNLLNSNQDSFVCVDVGSGMESGLAAFPSPLGRGGATVTDPGSEGDFGPYDLPLAFTVEGTNWHHFDDARIHVGDSYTGWLPNAQGTDRYKALAVVMQFVNRENGSNVVRELMVGAAAEPSSPPQPGAQVLAGTPSLTSWQAGSMPPIGAALSVPDVGVDEPFELTAVVRGGSIQCSITFTSGTITPAPLVVTQLPDGTALDVQEVRGVFLRAAGFVTNNNEQRIRIAKITTTAPNIAAYDGTITGATLAPPSEPILGRVRDRFVRRGQFEAGGVNTTDLLSYFCGYAATPEYGEKVLDELVEKTELRVIRFAPSNVNTLYTKPLNAPGWPTTNMALLDLWKNDPDAYFRGFDRLIDEVGERGVLLIPVLVWGSEQFLAWTLDAQKTDFRVKSTMDQAGNLTYGIEWVRELYGLPANLDPGLAFSAADLQAIDDARAEMAAYVESVVERYSDRPEIAFWEVGNEWDNKLDRDSTPTVWETVAYPTGFPTDAKQQPGVSLEDNLLANPSYTITGVPAGLTTSDFTFFPSTWAPFWLTPSECATAQGIVVDSIRAKDAVHMIGSGHSNLAANVLGGDKASGSLTWPNYQTLAANMAAFTDPRIEAISDHHYQPPQKTYGSPSYIFENQLTGYSSMDIYFVFMRDIVRHMTGTGPIGRCLYMGETDSGKPLDFADPVIGPGAKQEWLDLLDAMIGTDATLTRMGMALIWTWMPNPSIDPYVDHRHVMGPDQLTQDHPLQFFAEIAADHWAEPRIVSAGFPYDNYGINGHQGLRVEAVLEDPQNDVTSVELWMAGPPDVLVTPLTDQGNGTWSADLTAPLVNWPLGGQQKFRIRASDGTRDAVEWPRQFVGTPGPTQAFPATQAPVLRGRGRPNYPVIRRAGFLGFSQVSLEGSDQVFVAEVTYPFGVDPAAQTAVFLRLSQFAAGGLPDWTAWSAQFPVLDDGLGADAVAGDGVFTMALPVTPQLAASLAGVELFLEARPLNTLGGSQTLGDIWPYFVK